MKYIIKRLHVEGKQDDKVHHKELGWVYLGYESGDKWDVKKALDYEEDEEYTIDKKDIGRFFVFTGPDFNTKLFQVSEEATFIKEGDQFDEEDLLKFLK